MVSHCILAIRVRYSVAVELRYRAREGYVSIISSECLIRVVE